MNIVRINGTTAEQMFQYAFYLALHTHDDQARLDVPDASGYSRCSACPIS